jgi:hypothetical protein
MTARITFLTAVLPPLEPGEHYCSWGIKQTNIRQQFATSLEELIQQCDDLNVEGYNSFYALAKFGPKEQGRYAANALALRSFFLDLDCGEGKPYATLDDGLVALKQFCKAAKMPKPSIIQSGRGAHVYWTLEEPLVRADWKAHAEQLKALCVEHKFDIDYAVPADAARVLRMLGTTHLKDPENPIPVEVLMTAPPVSLATMHDLLAPVLSVLDQYTGPKQYDALTLALMGTTESRFKTILTKSLNGEGCAQIAHIVVDQAEVSEPLWRAGLSIAQVCTDRDKAIHGMSKLHPDYNAATTERKAAETKGPYTCETFRKLNPTKCEGCTLQITSPIQLGKEVIEATEQDNIVSDLEPETKEVRTYVIPKYPFPFFRGKNGGVFMHTKTKEGEQTEEAVYPYDFYVVKRMEDPDLGETLLLRLHLPKDGVREFHMSLSSAVSKEKFVSITSSKGVTAMGRKQELLMQYVAKFVEELQNSDRAEKAHKQFGWLEDDSGIIVGDREIRATTIEYSPPTSATLPVVPLLQSKGDFRIWKDIINAYGEPGREARAFAFFMGFGALLMKFTPLDGFLLNLVNKESGSGKTTILHAINSIYGRPKELMLAPKDTINHRMQRMGTMQNLAITMDEITNMPPDQMSQFVYDVTSGRGKHRLKQHENAERGNHTKWATGVVTSSNRYIVDALMSIKGFPDGELKRVLEVSIKGEDGVDAAWSRNHFGRIFDNYGHAIEPFAQMLVGQLPLAKQVLVDTQVRVDRAADIRNSERYWAAQASLSLAGGVLSKQLGLHDIPLKPVFDFGVQLIRDTRTRSRDYMFDTDEFLGSFLQKHFHEILVINGLREGRSGLEQAAIREPRGALLVRFEPDTKLLYVTTKAFRDDCAKQMLNFEEVISPYRASGALVGTKKKRMAAGTVASTEAAVGALCFDITKLGFFKESVLLDHNEAFQPDADS